MKFCSQCGTRVAAAQPAAAGRHGEGEIGERRQLTVLFCDLVGSMRLSARLDPEDWRDLVHAYQHAVSGVVEKHGGHVAQYLGDGVLVYFGYPRARENDAERAVRAGLDIVPAIHAVNASLGADRQLAVRLGIHTGRVVVTELGGPARPETLALGETTNVAARLQAIAAPDTVVISAATQRLVPGIFVVEELGAQSLKGVPAPITCYGVLRPSGVRSRLDVAAGRLSPFVGRDMELGTLLDRWERVTDAEGQNVLVVGEAGVGKSRLAYELRERLVAEPHTWLECRATPYTQGTPFFPVIELVAQGLAFAPEDTAADRMDKLQRGLDGLGFALDETVPLIARFLGLPLPEASPAIQMSPELQRQKTIAILAAWNLALAEAQPLVLLIEDLHWFDSSSLELLGRIIEQSPTARVLLLGTARREFAPPWPARFNLTTLQLARLTKRQAREMIVSLSTRALPADTIDTLVARADGVPLFIEELTKVVAEPDAAHGVDAIPATLADSLMGRLDQLSEAKEVAQRAAVLGREFSYPLLAAMWDLDEAMLRRGLARLVDEEILFMRGEPWSARYTFKHALVQEAAYDSLLKRTRRRYHERIAVALESCLPAIGEYPPEPLAHHFTEAGLYARAIPYWHQAGQRSTERSAPVEAIRSLTRGLECVGRLPESRERSVLELGLRTLLGANLLAVRGYTAPEVSENCARSLDLLPGLDDSPQIRSVVWALWLYHHVRSDRGTVQYLAGQFRTFAEGSNDDEALCRAAITDAITAYWQGDFERARRYATEGRARYRAEMRAALPMYGDDPGAYGYIYEAMSLWFQGRPDHAHVWMQRGLVMAEQINYAFTTAAALSFATQLQQLCRDAPAAEALAERTIAYCQEQGFPLYLGAALAHRGWARATQGRIEQGLEDLVTGVTLYRATGAVVNVAYLLALLAEGHLLAGQRASGLLMAEEGLALTAQHLDRYFEAELHRVRGVLLLLEPADPEAAEAALRQALTVAAGQNAGELQLRATASLARLLGERGRADEARPLLRAQLQRGAEAGRRPDLVEAEAVLVALG